MIEHVKLQLELSTKNPEVVDDPIGKLAVAVSTSPQGAHREFLNKSPVQSF